MFSGLFGDSVQTVDDFNKYMGKKSESKMHKRRGWKKRIARRKIAKASRKKNYQVLGKRG